VLTAGWAVCVDDAAGADPSELLQPCGCNRYVHRACLRQWAATRQQSGGVAQVLTCEVCTKPLALEERCV
jgi:E3 ubiquitin-protein ligase DOA10